MRVAVTGISSELGKTLIPLLQNEPTIEKIVGIDINKYEGDMNKIDFAILNILDKGEMEKALKDVDVLIHLAFIVLPKKIPKKKVIYDVNVNGSNIVFQAAAKNEIKKIIYISSQSAYGHLPECSTILDENSPILGVKNTNFYYSHTKALVEVNLDEFEKMHPKIAVIRLRAAVLSGPHFLNLSEKIIRTALITKRTVFPLNHNGVLPTQLIHEEDLSDIIILMLKNSVRGVYNIGSNVVPDLSEFIKEKKGIHIKPAPKFLSNFLQKLGKINKMFTWIQGMKYISVMNTDKIETEFDWKPKYSTEKCLEDMLEL